MNALYLKDLAQKTHRGLEGRVRSGMSGGGICYGYDLVPGQPGALRLNQAEAAIVLRILEEYAAGRSPRAITMRLNQEGVPGPFGRPWRDTTIRATSCAEPASSTTSSLSASESGTGCTMARTP
jgi:site-specific DNA recombinase